MYLIVYIDFFGLVSFIVFGVLLLLMLDAFLVCNFGLHSKCALTIQLVYLGMVVGVVWLQATTEYMNVRTGDHC